MTEFFPNRFTSLPGLNKLKKADTFNDISQNNYLPGCKCQP